MKYILYKNQLNFDKKTVKIQAKGARKIYRAPYRDHNF